MNRLLQTDNLLYSILNNIADLITLNVLWLLCCLPIITIGPGTTALYYVSLKMAEHQSPYIAKSFFHSLKENLRDGIFFTLFFIVLIAFLYWDVQIALALPGFAGQLLLSLFIFLSAGCLITLVYLFPVLARFRNTFLGTIKAAFLLGIRHLPSTLLLLFLDSLPWLLLFLFPGTFLKTLPIWLLIGFAAIARINSFFIARVFAPLMPVQADEGGDV